MSFAVEWLALREPYDIKARSAVVCNAALASLADRFSVSLVDLACGTGATLRALSPHLPKHQNWKLVDNDLSLLARSRPIPPLEGVNVTTTPADLSYDIESVLDGPIDLVTTTAFLDLVSDDWLERFAMEAAARHLPVYAALTYDGRVSLEPSFAADERMISALNRHQLGDKGFGPALGTTAAATAVARFESLGYMVTHEQSDWVFSTDDRRIQLALISGWTNALYDMVEVSDADVRDWSDRRNRAIADGISAIRVGHVDFFAQPAGMR